MINANQLFKAGRKTKIFEVSDKLVVNDFYNNTGFITSHIEGKMSRIKITIVDISKGKKSNANVGEFNFTSAEWRQHTKYLLNSRNFKGIFNKGLIITKANPYKKINNVMIEVKSLKITFEDGLDKPKWKFEIITGMAKPKDDFGYDVKSYKELKRVNFLLDIIEVNSMVEYVTEYIQLWKQANFNKFLENRQAFSIRAYENGYDEKSINSWNSNKNENKTKEDTDSNYNTSVQNRVYNGDVADQSSSTRNGQIAPKEQYYCEDCGAILSKKNAITTKKSFKKALCSNCLKNNLGK